MNLEISMIDEDRSATCSSASLDVSPAVSNSKTSTEIDVQVPRGGEQHARLGFTAVTAIRIVMITYPNIIKPNAAAQEAVYVLNSLARQMPTGYFGLVRDDDQKKTITAQPLARLWDA